MCHFDKFQNQPPGESREHLLGEVLQGRVKSKFGFIFKCHFGKFKNQPPTRRTSREHYLGEVLQGRSKS